MLDLAIALQASCLTVSVAKFSGIIKDKLSLKIDRLSGSEFEAGLRALEQAATSEREREHLLREARARFNRAISLEKDFRLAASLLGLALCHVNLGDAVNAARAIMQLIEVQPPHIPSVKPFLPLAMKANRWCHMFAMSTIALPGEKVVAALAAATKHIEHKQISEYRAMALPLLELQAEARSFVAICCERTQAAAEGAHRPG
jgi:hypothetical protein